MITTAAHEINQGRPPHLEPGEDQEHDFFFIERPNPERALATVVEVVAERAPKSFGVDPVRDVQVLAPMYRGAIGIDALNERLQAAAQPRRRARRRRALPDRRPPDPDPQLARAGADERLDRLPRARTTPTRKRSSSTPTTAARWSSPTTRPRRCGSPTRSRSTRRRAARCRSSSASATAPTRGC